MYRLLPLSLLLFSFACGSEGTPLPPASDTEPAGAQPVADQAIERRDFAQQRVDRVDRMYLEGRLRCDTLSYTCATEERGGTFTLCYLGDDLVKADHLATPARPTMVYSEVYYLEDSEVYFATLASDPPTEQGSGLPTVETRYYYEGELIDRTGPPLRGALEATTLLQVAERGSYTCE